MRVCWECGSSWPSGLSGSESKNAFNEEGEKAAFTREAEVEDEMQQSKTVNILMREES